MTTPHRTHRRPLSVLVVAVVLAGLPTAVNAGLLPLPPLPVPIRPPVAVPAPLPAPIPGGELRVGVATVDASWRVGAGSGQYTEQETNALGLATGGPVDRPSLPK